MAATAAPPHHAHNDLLGRTRHIAAVLTSHGLGWLVDQAELAGRLPHWRRRPAPDDGPRPTGVHLRRAFEDLGATFIKLGQVLSTRGDLLPADVIDELSKLQDAVPAAPFAELRPVLERELGEAGLARFPWIDEHPLGSASIGQVHAARLDGGEEVVIKIQRPGVARLIEQDLQILRRLVRWLSANTAFGRDYDLTAVADEFAESLRAQLDFWREAQTADEFRRHFDDEPLLRVPRVQWTLTTTRVLTLERFDGIKISDLAALDRAGLSRRAIARNAVRFMVRQMFEHGVFHADPHPGNFFVQPNGAIALFDYGMVGRLGEGTRERLLHTGLMAIRRDAPGLAEDLFALGVVGRRTERGPFERDLEHVMDRYAGASLRDLAAAEVVREVVSLAFRHKVQLPGNLALLMRVVAMGEGLGLRLDPEFRFFEYVGPMLARQWERQHTLERTVRRIGGALLEAADLGAALPRRMGRLFGRLERGEIEFNVRHEGLEEMTRRFERMTNRLALAVILGASIVALAMVFGIYHPAGWERFGGWLFGTAFVASLAFGAVVLFAIWRSGGRR